MNIDKRAAEKDKYESKSAYTAYILPTCVSNVLQRTEYDLSLTMNFVELQILNTITMQVILNEVIRFPLSYTIVEEFHKKIPISLRQSDISGISFD